MQEEIKEEHQDAHEDKEEEEPVYEPAEWVQFRDPTDMTYDWNRRTFTTSWNSPPGMKVVWVGEKTEEEGIWYWHRSTRASQHLFSSS